MSKRTVKIPIKVRTQARVRTQVRSSGTHSTRLGSWTGPAPSPTINNYGDTNTINGDSNLMAVGTSGDVVQIAAAPAPVDPTALAHAARDLLRVLPTIEIDTADRNQLRADAEAALAEATSSVPDHHRLRRLGRAIANTLSTVATSAAGGTVAQALAPAMLNAVAA